MRLFFDDSVEKGDCADLMDDVSTLYVRHCTYRSIPKRRGEGKRKYIRTTDLPGDNSWYKNVESVVNEGGS